MQNNNTINCIIVDDEHSSQRVLQYFIKETDALQLKQTCNNASEAFKYLELHTNINLIFLDINMPKINGIEFLTILKKDPNLRHIPTVILTTSNNQKDLLECYKIGVSGYVLKPLKYEDYVSEIESLLNYWSINELINI